MQRKTAIMADMLKEPTRGTPEGDRIRLEEVPTQGRRFLLSFLTCVGKTQNFWLLRLLKL